MYMNVLYVYKYIINLLVPAPTKLTNVVRIYIHICVYVPILYISTFCMFDYIYISTFSACARGC